MKIGPPVHSRFYNIWDCVLCCCIVFSNILLDFPAGKEIGGVWQVMQCTDVRNKLILLTSGRGEKTMTQQNWRQICTQRKKKTIAKGVCVDWVFHRLIKVGLAKKIFRMAMKTLGGYIYEKTICFATMEGCNWGVQLIEMFPLTLPSLSCDGWTPFGIWQMSISLFVQIFDEILKEQPIWSRKEILHLIGPSLKEFYNSQKETIENILTQLD